MLGECQQKVHHSPSSTLSCFLPFFIDVARYEFNQITVVYTEPTMSIPKVLRSARRVSLFRVGLETGRGWFIRRHDWSFDMIEATKLFLKIGAQVLIHELYEPG